MSACRSVLARRFRSTIHGHRVGRRSKPYTRRNDPLPLSRRTAPLRVPGSVANPRTSRIATCEPVSPVTALALEIAMRELVGADGRQRVAHRRFAHIASIDFYERVQNFLDTCDVTLFEGVGGLGVEARDPLDPVGLSRDQRSPTELARSTHRALASRSTESSRRTLTHLLRSDEFGLPLLAGGDSTMVSGTTFDYRVSERRRLRSSCGVVAPTAAVGGEGADVGPRARVGSPAEDPRTAVARRESKSNSPAHSASSSSSTRSTIVVRVGRTVTWTPKS